MTKKSKELKEKQIYDKDIIEQLETDGTFVANPICIHCLHRLIELINDNFKYITISINMLDKDFYSAIIVNNEVLDKDTMEE